MKTCYKLIYLLCLLTICEQVAFAQTEEIAEVVNVNQSNSTSSSASALWEWILSLINPPTALHPPSNTTTETPGTGTEIPRECSQCFCGIANTLHRIVGGQETIVNAYPWMAALFVNGHFFCGGSLINDEYVATASHCLRPFRAESITIRFLDHYRNGSMGIGNIITRKATALKIHERYSTRNLDNDIGLIRLSEPIEINEFIRPICLPSLEKTFAGDCGLVTGWGAIGESQSLSTFLREVEVPILTHTECTETSYGANHITKNMLCAGYKDGGKDACQGDSGGPLHIRVPLDNSTEYQLAGIVSWGDGCARPNAPGVYTRVNQYNKWIMANTPNACNCPSQSNQ